jgi:hypothetical protein
MTQNNNEEIDLGLVFKKIGDFYRTFLVRLYRGFHFVLRNWIVFLLLIVAGVLMGYYLDKNTKASKETSLIVQINFDASNYVYDAIEQLNRKIEDYDTIALAKMGIFNKGELIVSAVTIEPVVNLLDILKTAPRNDRNIEVLLDESQISDDLLTTELFKSEYRAHRILISTSSKATDSDIEDLMNYLNSNKILNRIKVTKIENTKRKIEYNTQSIAYLDSIFKVTGSKTGTQKQTNQIYFNSYDSQTDNFYLMFREKRVIQNENEEMEIELLKYDHIVETLNMPILQIKKPTYSMKIVVPLLFVLLFIFGSGLKMFYDKAKKLNQERE